MIEVDMDGERFTLSWTELHAAWRWAQLSDAEFIAYATQLGKESNAIALINEDLQTP